MKPSTEDKTTGKLHDVKGTIKQKNVPTTQTWNLRAELKRVPQGSKLGRQG